MQRVRRQLGCSDRLQFEAGIKGVTVAILDTGIGLHPDLQDRVVAFQDFVNGRRNIYDDSGHGTHVAGCIGGDGTASNGIYKGIAPACLFCVGKVLDQKGEGDVDNMNQGIRWVLENQERYQIRVLNISVGIGQTGEAGRMRELIEGIDRLWTNGIVVVCAAGNSGPEEDTISPLGSSRRVITVGCHEGGYFGSRRDLCENYSGRGSSLQMYRKPDLVAPGTDIISCNVDWRSGRRGGYYNAYTKKSGTSMATPVVSGAAALVLQKYPQMKNEEVKRRMVYSAKNMGEPWNKQGWGMLDVEKLFQIC